MDRIVIKGAREHTLKNLDIVLPRDRFIVISGVSGSGKSSLAFDTIFAEGQRRYVESLSAYARQFLGQMEKPDVDYIEGLSPAISIEQKTTNRNPRSTVGTVTEIYDYFRLLYARIGIPHDPKSGKRIEKQSVDQIVDTVLRLPEGTRLSVLAPVVRGRKGEHERVFSDARRAGFARVRVNGDVMLLEEVPKLHKQKKHSIEVVVDRLKVNDANRQRIAESVEQALELAGGLVIVEAQTESETFERSYSQQYFYPDSDLAFPELEPRLFSFNNPFGACPDCSGLGIRMEFDPRRIVPDGSLSFEEHGIAPYNPGAAWNRSRFESLAKHYGFDLSTPWDGLDASLRKVLMYGGDEKIEMTYENREGTGRFQYQSNWPGMVEDLRRRYRETTSPGVKDWLEGFMSRGSCPSCGGKRLRPEALGVRVGEINIHDLTAMSVRDALVFFRELPLNDTERAISEQILKEITDRLSFLEGVGLNYLTLDRSAATLSGGEAQRIRLATQIGSSLVGVLYILDEPSIGLHQRDNERLLRTLLHLRDIGNTLIVVEHDEQTLREADHVVDLGPGAGVHGGYLVAQGTPQEVMANPESLTGRYLSGMITIDRHRARRPGNGSRLEVLGASLHNLRSVDVSIPLGTLTVITGVSGSGKSTLLTEVIYPYVRAAVGRGASPGDGPFRTIRGAEQLDAVIAIDQSPIGRTPRSNPATYVGLFTPIRKLFSELPEARARGYSPGRFSFNVKGGRCENCEGAGTVRIEMHFLPDVYVTCDVCGGKRFNRETLEVHYKGKSIYDVLEMTVEEAAGFFSAIPAVSRKLETLCAVGLDYVKLGQSALTLSGGEAQRVKLSLELSKRSTGSTFYILDEPTTGLHFADVKKLLEVLQLLVDKGNTIVLIEHNLDVICQSDNVIDLGPEGGDEGGRVVAVGKPEEIAEVGDSHTGRFIRQALAGS